MKIELQVCSLEQSKILKELGIVQESFFVWQTFRNESSPKDQWSIVHEVLEMSDNNEDYLERDYLKDKQLYSAFTVAEMSEMIGKGTKASEKHWQWLLDCVNSGLSGTVAYNPVALAGFVITVIKNGELPIKDVNNRLNRNRS